jgi:hypothetical protein
VILVYECTGSHQLFDDGFGKLCLDVVVGTIAQYLVRIDLTSEEASRYHEEGKAFVDAFANDVCRREPHYRKLGRTRTI